MYKSIEQIRKLQNEKQAVLDRVYQVSSPDEVYKKQQELGSMSIRIFTDTANVLIPALQEDGVSSVVWSAVSLRLDRLTFISVPGTAEIREKYRKSVDHPVVVKVDGTAPRPGVRTRVKKIPLPAFLMVLAAQGIAIPLLLSAAGGTWLALVKILCVVNAACMVIEVVKYFHLFPTKSKTSRSGSDGEASASDADFRDMYRQAIREVYHDNRRRLNDWFDRLAQITAEEIEKAGGKTEE